MEVQELGDGGYEGALNEVGMDEFGRRHDVVEEELSEQVGLGIELVGLAQEKVPELAGDSFHAGQGASVPQHAPASSS